MKMGCRCPNPNRAPPSGSEAAAASSSSPGFPRPYRRAAVEDRLRKLGCIVSGREQSRHDLRLRPWRGPWDRAPRRATPPRFFVYLCRCSACEPGQRRKEARSVHPQRSKDERLGVLVESYAAHLLHQFAQHNEVDIAVGKGRSRRVDQPLGVSATIPLFHPVHAGRKSRSARSPE